MSIHKRSTKKGNRYDVRLRDPNGRGYTRTFDTLREAQAFAAGELHDRRRGVWVDPRLADTTFAEWAKHWQESNPSKRPKTLESEENILRLHVLPALGGRAMATVTPVDMQNLVNKWAKSAAPNSVRRRYALTKAIFAAAVEAEVLGRSPCKKSIRLPKVVAGDKRVMTAGEVAAMAVEVGSDYGPLVLLGAVSGLRIGELAGLQVRDLDFFTLTLTVRRNVNEVKGQLVIDEPKTAAGRRTMAIPTALRDVLSEHLRRRRLTAADGDSWLFPSPDGARSGNRRFTAVCGTRPASGSASTTSQPGRCGTRTRRRWSATPTSRPPSTASVIPTRRSRCGSTRSFANRVTQPPRKPSARNFCPTPKPCVR